MNTYMNQLRGDEAKIAADNPLINEAAMLERIGRNSALSHYYAGVADFEAAQRQRLSRDPKALMAVFCDRPGGPSAADFAVLLDYLHAYLRLRPELADADFHVEHAAAEMQATAVREAYNREVDLDAPAAARSDDEYDRKVDAGLIGRSDFMPVAS